MAALKHTIRTGNLPQTLKRAGDPYPAMYFVLLAASLIGANAAYYGRHVSRQSGAVCCIADAGTGRRGSGGCCRGAVAAPRASNAGFSNAGDSNERRAAVQIAQEQVPPLNPVLARLQQVRGNVASGWIRVPEMAGQIGVPRLIGMATALAGGRRIGYLLLQLLSGGTQTNHRWHRSRFLSGRGGTSRNRSRYLGAVEAELLPSAPLRRGARVTGWMLVLATLSMVLEWGSPEHASERFVLSDPRCQRRVLHWSRYRRTATARLDEGFSRWTWESFPSSAAAPISLASILDSAEQQLGVDVDTRGLSR